MQLVVLKDVSTAVHSAVNSAARSVARSVAYLVASMDEIWVAEKEISMAVCSAGKMDTTMAVNSVVC